MDISLNTKNRKGKDYEEEIDLLNNNPDSCFINVSKKPEIENISIPHNKEFKTQKPILHEAGNPIMMLLFSVIGLSGISFRKII